MFPTWTHAQFSMFPMGMNWFAAQESLIRICHPGPAETGCRDATWYCLVVRTTPYRLTKSTWLAPSRTSFACRGPSSLETKTFLVSDRPGCEGIFTCVEPGQGACVGNQTACILHPMGLVGAHAPNQTHPIWIWQKLVTMSNSEILVLAYEKLQCMDIIRPKVSSLAVLHSLVNPMSNSIARVIKNWFWRTCYNPSVILNPNHHLLTYLIQQSWHIIFVRLQNYQIRTPDNRIQSNTRPFPVATPANVDHKYALTVKRKMTTQSRFASK
jgi:hypothetical protein